MTEAEAEFVGVLADYYPDAAAVSNNFPRAFLVQRYDASGSPHLVHGVLQGAGSDEDAPYGDAYSQWGGNPWGRGPLEVASTPTAGKINFAPDPDLAAVADDVSALEALLFDPSYASVGRADPSYDLTLNADTWDVLDGGAAALAQGVTYDDGTGDVTVAAAGVYRISLTVTAQRGGILTTQADAAVFVDGSQSSVISTAPLELLSAYSLAASDVLQLSAGAVLTARVRSSLALTLTASRWALALDRIA